MKYLLFIILLVPIVGFGQEEYQDIRELFPKPNAQVEVKTFKGYLNHIHPVVFLLGTKDGIVKGTYRLSSSGNIISLNGTFQNNTYSLFEIYNGKDIGRIIIDTKNPDNSFWTDISNSDILPLAVSETKFGELAIDNKNGIVAQYVSASKKHNIHLVAERTDLDRAYLKIWIDDRLIEAWTRCDNELCVTSQFDKQISFFQNDTHPHFKIGESHIPLKKVHEGTIKKFAYATTNMLIDIDYITDIQTNYDQWIRTVILNERKNNIGKIQSLVEKDSSLTHFRYQWVGWQEIDEMNEQIISGRLVWYESWTEQTKTIPFLYSFETKTIIDQNNAFRSPEDKQEMLSWIYKQDNPNKHCVEMLPEEVITDYEFTNYTISNQKLILLTDFSPIYGYKKVLLPYQEAKKWLSRKSLVKKLLK